MNLPVIEGYTLHAEGSAEGETLVIRPDCWLGYLSELPEAHQQRQRIVDVVEQLHPSHIILDLEGLGLMPAMLTSLVVRLGKLVDFTHSPGRFAIRNCDPTIREYLARSQLEPFITFDLPADSPVVGESTVWQRVLLAGLAAGAGMFGLGAAIHFALATLAPGLTTTYANTALFRPWAGWTQVYMAVHPFGLGIVFSWLYASLGLAGPRRIAKNPALRGMRQAAILFVAGSLPIFLLHFAALQMPVHLFLLWTAQNLGQYLLAGAILGWLYARF